MSPISPLRRTRRAKIVATLGPASSDRATIKALCEAGVDVFRLNFSHGTQADHRARFELIRSVELELGRPLAVLLDLQGPKLRIGTFSNGPVTLHEGRAFGLTSISSPVTAHGRRCPTLKSSRHCERGPTCSSTTARSG